MAGVPGEASGGIISGKHEGGADWRRVDGRAKPQDYVARRRPMADGATRRQPPGGDELGWRPAASRFILTKKGPSSRLAPGWRDNENEHPKCCHANEAWRALPALLGRRAAAAASKLSRQSGARRRRPLLTSWRSYLLGPARRTHMNGRNELERGATGGGGRCGAPTGPRHQEPGGAGRPARPTQASGRGADTPTHQDDRRRPPGRAPERGANWLNRVTTTPTGAGREPAARSDARAALGAQDAASRPAAATGARGGTKKVRARLWRTKQALAAARSARRLGAPLSEIKFGLANGPPAKMLARGPWPSGAHGNRRQVYGAGPLARARPAKTRIQMGGRRQPPTGAGAAGLDCGPAARARPSLMIDCARATSGAPRPRPLATISFPSDEWPRPAAPDDANRNEHRHRHEHLRRKLTSTTSGGSTTTISTRAENKKPLLRLVVVAAALLLSLVSSGAANGRTAPDHRLNFWRSLVRPFARAIGAQREPADRLATKLANWPDQRRAALFYIELLARRGGAAGDQFCRRVSLAELFAGGAGPADGASAHSSAGSTPAARQRTSAYESRADNNDDDEPSEPQIGQLRAQVALDELGDKPSSSSQPDGRERPSSRWLNRHQSATANLAKLAVENANLISRLLLQPTPGPGRVRRSSGGGALPSSMELLGQLATPRFLRYLLESKVRQLSAPAPSSSNSSAHPQPYADTLLHSAGLVFVEPLEGRAGRNPSPKVIFAPLAIAKRNKRVDMIELLAHPVAAPDNTTTKPASYFNGSNGAPSFLLKWFLANSLNELELIERRLSNWLISSDQDQAEQEEEERGGRARGQPAAAAADGAGEEPADSAQGMALKLEDGSWFSPHFDCAITNRWLLTYSIPFFAQLNGSVRFR